MKDANKTVNFVSIKSQLNVSLGGVSLLNAM